MSPRPVAERVSAGRQRLRRVEGRHNALIKRVRLAFARAELTDEGYCAIEGLRIIEEAIRSGLHFRAVLIRESSEERADRLLQQISSRVDMLLVPDRLFDSAVPSESPQGIAALVRLKEFSFDDVLRRLHLGPIVLLAGLQDPGNLGTVLRSAEAFGSAGVMLGDRTVSPFNSKVVRGSAGSVFRLPIVLAKSGNGKLENISANLREHGVRVVATSSHKGTRLDAANLTGSLAILIGSEGAGVPRALMSKVDETIMIPHAPQVESLNAGVAASIVLYEASRQRTMISDSRPTMADSTSESRLL